MIGNTSLIICNSIVSPTFNRTDQLPAFFDTYANGSVPSLKRIVMLWNNAEVFPEPLRQTLT